MKIRAFVAAVAGGIASMRIPAFVAAVAVGIASPVTARAREPEPAPPTSSEAVPEVPSEASLETQAQEAFAAGRYDEVVALAAEAYARTGQIRHLYAQAHAERFAGHCDAALGLYARVMAAEPDSVLGQHAREGIKLCEQSLPREPPPPEPVAPTVVAPTPAPTPTKADTRARAGDPLGGTLLGLGLAAFAASASLAVVSASHARRLDRADDERTLLDEQRKARGFEAGAITLGVVGTGLVVGGIIRLVQRSRRSGSTPRSSAHHR